MLCRQFGDRTRRGKPDGPFTPVPDGSPLMSPGNRANPDTTTADGTFGWDVLTGYYYQVQASKSGCTSPQDPNATTVTSRPFEVPPPMTGLRLTLECASAALTTLTYTGPTTADTHDAITASAVLTDQASRRPVLDQNVTITFADQTCTAVTDSAGTASCTVTPQTLAGASTAQASFAGADGYQSSTSSPVAVTLQPDESAVALSLPIGLANGKPATLTASLTEDGQAPLAGRPITFTLGSGTTSQTCTAITGSDGVARCPLPVDQPLGPIPLAATFGGDGYNEPADASASTIAFAYPATGAFVVGDGNAVVGVSVTLWSPQWCAQNGADPCPAAFKGYADSAGITPYQDGGTWTASPGASSDPPNTVPTYVAVLTTDAVTKSGSTMSGTISHAIIVKVDFAGRSPGSPTTGQVVALLN